MFELAAKRLVDPGHVEHGRPVLEERRARDSEVSAARGKRVEHKIGPETQARHKS